MNGWISRLQRQPYLLLVLATFFWGSNFVFARVLVETVPPIHLSFIRWITGFLFFLPFAYVEWQKHKQVLMKKWKVLLLLALTGVAGFNALLNVAVQYTSSINASLVNATAPLMIVLLSVLILHERVRMIQYIGIMISLFGVMWIITQGKLDTLLTFSLNKGDIFVILAVICWSIYSVIMKKWGSGLPKKATFLTTIVFCLFILFPFLWLEAKLLPFEFSDLSFIHWLGMIYLGIFPSVISFICWNEGVLQIGPSKSSIYLYLIVVFAGLLAFFFGETYTYVQFMGAIIIFCGVLITSNPNISTAIIKNRGVKNEATRTNGQG